MRIDFVAPEYRADQSFAETAYRFEGSPRAGWAITRDGRAHLELGPGYRALRTRACGVCSTDLARHHLPFPLPQVIGHEVLAVDESGRRHVVEINASHRARGVATDCPFCAADLETHCPERIVLGIHDLPGGFGPWLLAPVDAVLPVPDEIPSSTAVLVEPFAAALHAVTTIAPRDGDRVAVLGPRRLGMLVVAALRAHRERHGLDLGILALSRHEHLLELAMRLGATGAIRVEGEGEELDSGLADVVVDTTGNPRALELAVRLARREVHLKSTHGRPSCGLDHLTELVVDELTLERLPATACAQRPGDGRPRCAWLAPTSPPAWLRDTAEILHAPDARAALEALEEASSGRMPRADLAVVTGAAGVDAAVRPDPGREIALVRPRGEVWLAGDAAGSPLLDAIVRGGLRLSSSRCGDFRCALEAMAGDARLRRLGEELVTHRFASSDMERAFEAARSPACIKAVIEQPATEVSR